MTGLWSTEPPHRCERLARAEGQSNFLSLLAGIEAGPDTTEDMAALAFARSLDGEPPELLEAYWGASVLYRYQICQYVFHVIEGLGSGVAERDRLWVRGAILDAFDLFGGRKPDTGKNRAKQLHVRYEDYLATRKLAEGLLFGMTGSIQREWIRARFREL